MKPGVVGVKWLCQGNRMADVWFLPGMTEKQGQSQWVAVRMASTLLQRRTDSCSYACPALSRPTPHATLR